MKDCQAATISTLYKRLTALPDPLAGLRGVGWREGRRREGGGERIEAEEEGERKGTEEAVKLEVWLRR